VDAKRAQPSWNLPALSSNPVTVFNSLRIAEISSSSGRSEPAPRQPRDAKSNWSRRKESTAVIKSQVLLSRVSTVGRSNFVRTFSRLRRARVTLSTSLFTFSFH
jgi:hypothetical protein